MTKAQAEPDWPKVERMIAEALAAGTHGKIIQRVCGLCREWCDGHYHFTLDGTGLCRECYLKLFPPKVK